MTDARDEELLESALPAGRSELAEMPTAELAALARGCVDALGQRGGPEAFAELLRLTPAVGEALAVAARALGESSSWGQVGQLAGTSKQAAWARWRS